MLVDKKAVIFDLDGTLIDSMWMWEDIDIEFLSEHRIELPKDLQDCIEGMSFSETAVYFKERFHLPLTLEEIKDTWNRMAWKKYKEEVSLKKGALDYLKQLKQQGIKTGIATSNSRALVDLILDTLQIQNYFESVHTACEVENGKPSPDIYLLVAKDLCTAPEQCLVFEDVIQGIMAGKRAGMTVCTIQDEFSKETWMQKKALADYAIESFEDLMR